MKLYKYKSLPHKKELTAEEKEQLEYCKDILLNHRLFMAPRETLNDPFEGMAIPISLSICGSGSFGSLGLPHAVTVQLHDHLSHPCDKSYVLQRQDQLQTSAPIFLLLCIVDHLQISCPPTTSNYTVDCRPVQSVSNHNRIYHLSVYHLYKYQNFASLRHA